MKPPKGNTLVTIFLLALILRLVLIFPQFSGDVKNHLAWASGFLSHPIGFYSLHFPGFNDANYPPLAILLFSLSELLYQFVRNSSLFLNSHLSFFPSFLVSFMNWENTHAAFLKLPGVFSDIGLGYMIYLLTYRRSKSILPTLFYLFNPATIYLSATWGQIEPITNFFLVLALYWGIASDKKAIYFSILSFTLAALTKQTALWFGPLFLVLWLKEFNVLDIIYSLIVSISAFFFFYLPFGLWPIQALFNYLNTLSGSSNVVSDGAWNLWYFILPQGTEDSFTLGPFSIREISIFILVLTILFLTIKLFINYSQSRFFLFLFFWSLAVFFIQTRVHERHLAPAFVFILLTPGLNNRFYLDAIALSTYHFLNLQMVLGLPFV